MKNNRSSKDAFLLFIGQLKSQSSFVQLVGTTKRCPLVYVSGRVAAVGSNTFSVRGRGCEIQIDISGAATFEVFRAADMPVVPIRFGNGSPLRPEWSIGWRNGDVILFGERTLPPV
jgi:hypothetical protein